MATATASWREASVFQRVMIVAQTLLILLSYFATVSGFADLMEINLTGQLSIERVVQIVFVFAVATAVVMAMLIGLYTMLDRERGFTGRVTGALAYVFFLFWSVTFGYGFFWKTFAAEDFTRGQFTRDAAVIQSEVRRIVDTLRNVEDQANRAATLAAQRSSDESRPGGGGTCANNPASIGSGGPLAAARRDFASETNHQAQLIENEWIKPLLAEAGEINWRLRALDPALNASVMVADPPREGQPALKDAEELDRIRASIAQGSNGRKNEYDQVVARANNFVNEAIRLKSSVGESVKAEFSSLAKDVSESQGRPDPRWCEDLELADVMQRAAKEIYDLPEPKPISLNFLEGSAASRYATINLARTVISAITSQLGTSPPQTIGTEEITPLGENDIIALYAAAAIDVALLFVTILSRPPASPATSVSRVSRVFISYRRSDSPHAVDRLYEALKEHLPKSHIFIDVDNIPKGADYVQHLTDRVNECDVLLAIIGPHWLNQQDETGGRRLDDPRDFVRIEMAAAHNRNIPVVPVLLDGASMPQAQNLPDELHWLERRQAAHLRRESFRADTDQLIDDLGIRKSRLLRAGRGRRR